LAADAGIFGDGTPKASRLGHRDQYRLGLVGARSKSDLIVVFVRQRPATMTPPPPQSRKQPTSVETPPSNTLKFSGRQLVLAFVIAGMSDAIGAFTAPLPPIGWVADFLTALLLFLVLGRQWLLLPGLALEAIPGLDVLPFWLLVVGAIAVLGTPRPRFERR
jgi:hypothetical protein